MKKKTQKQTNEQEYIEKKINITIKIYHESKNKQINKVNEYA